MERHLEFGRGIRVTTRRKSDNAMVYVYGIVPEAFDVSRAPAGVDDHAVELVKRPPIAALASRVSPSEYGPDVIEQRSADVSWLSPRAVAHDRVLTWAQERDVVVPLPIFSLWTSEESLTRSLDRQRKDLTAVLKGVSGADEFGLRVHRRDREMLESLDDVDPEIKQLRAEAKAASLGQRYLLERKLADEGKKAVRAAGQRFAREIFEQLSALSRDAVARPLTPDRSRADEATLILNGAFLVDRTRLDVFRQAVADAQRVRESRGLAFDFTGPWPPYNFVGDRGKAFGPSRPAKKRT
jgi:hypothetical protein